MFWFRMGCCHADLMVWSHYTKQQLAFWTKQGGKHWINNRHTWEPWVQFDLGLRQWHVNCSDWLHRQFTLWLWEAATKACSSRSTFSNLLLGVKSAQAPHYLRVTYNTPIALWMAAADCAKNLWGSCIELFSMCINQQSITFNLSTQLIHACGNILSTWNTLPIKTSKSISLFVATQLLHEGVWIGGCLRWNTVERAAPLPA